MARRDRRRGGAHSRRRGPDDAIPGPSDAPDTAATVEGAPTASDQGPAPAVAAGGDGPLDPPEPGAPSGSPGSDTPESAAGPSASATGLPEPAITPPEPTGSPATGDVGADAGSSAGPAAAAASADLGARMTRQERRRASGTASGTKPAAKKKAKQKRTWLDRALLAGVVLVSLAIVAVGSGYAYIQYRFGQVTKVTVKHLRAVPAGSPFNVLMIGSDSRSGFTQSDQQSYGNASTAGGQRSDVIKILHVVPATRQVSVLSIPRDTVVHVAGDTSEIGEYNRINATFNNGPDQLVQTIEANFGIPIEHVVQLNFVGFRGAVDAIGGVNLDFPVPAKDVYTGLDITSAGCQHLDGGYALAVARSRHYQYYENGYWHYDGTSDYGRIQRQNAFLKSLINQAEKQYNPLTLNAFIGSVVEGVVVDSTFTVQELISLAQEFRTFASTSLATATLPTYAAESSDFASLGSVIYVQQPQADQVISQFLGAPAPTPRTPPPGPYGVPATTTTATTTAPPTTYSTGGTTPATSTTGATTTTIQTDFDPTPC